MEHNVIDTIGYINKCKSNLGQPVSKATSPTVLESSQTINQLQGQGGSLRGHKVFVVDGGWFQAW